MSISGADLVRLKEFMEREGYTSPHVAMRVLALSAIDTYPKLGISREERAAIVQAARQRLAEKIFTMTEEMRSEFCADADVDRNAEATIEKGQVTFSREDQE